MRSLLPTLGLCIAGRTLVYAQASFPNIASATIESVKPIPEKGGIAVIVKNTGLRPITAFSFKCYATKSSGERIPCGGRGVDMIDWSDPMPGRNLFVHMRRNLISPGAISMLDGYPQCPGQTVALEDIKVELSFVLFDDGDGEGSARQIDFALRTRQQVRNERLKWLDRFRALRDAADLRAASRSLYQDLVDATRAAEIDPEEASQQGIAKSVRHELQELALNITEWAARNSSLKENELLAWRLTDLEQRSARLLAGAGKVDINPR